VETINYELIFADLDTLAKRLAKSEKMIKTGDKKYPAEVAVIKKLIEALEAGQPARHLELTQAERALSRDFFLLTDKPIIYVANIAEDDLKKDPADLPLLQKLKAYVGAQGDDVLVVSAKVEEELSGLEPEEKELFIEELGIGESGLSKLIRASYSLLGLISYLTAGPKEVRAWTIQQGTRAPQAAGKIHTDFERGFIRAEVIAFDTLKELGGDMQAAKEKGLVRQEGKDYVVQDGDVVLFRFNV
jgi:GTP-binding protein YchF